MSKLLTISEKQNKSSSLNPVNPKTNLSLSVKEVNSNNKEHKKLHKNLVAKVRGFSVDF